MSLKHKALFISHGGGPMPLLGDPGHQEMVSCLERIATRLPKPDAILVISAHWESAVPTITSGASPQLIYDYHGFPEESYHIQYPAPGAPSVANKVHGLLSDAGIDAKLDEERGFDHGMFVPLKILYPQADVPCVQLSLSDNLDPALHIKIGQALTNLASDNVLIIGSGFSFHNMREFFKPSASEPQDLNQSFEHWLHDTCCNPDYSESERAQRLEQWSQAPGAQFCHPREEHLLPLHVCYGAAQAPCTEHFELKILGKKASMYLW